MVHAFRLLLIGLLLTLAGSSGEAALTLENRAGEKSGMASELSLGESPQALPTHQENGGGYDELAADRLSFQSEDPIGTSGGDFNFHRYTANNPLQYVDGNGLTAAEFEISRRWQASITSLSAYTIANVEALAFQRTIDAIIVGTEKASTLVGVNKLIAIAACQAAVGFEYKRTQTLLDALYIREITIQVGVHGATGLMLPTYLYGQYALQARAQWFYATVQCYGSGVQPPNHPE